MKTENDKQWDSLVINIGNLSKILDFFTDEEIDKLSVLKLKALQHALSNIKERIKNIIYFNIPYNLREKL